MSASYVHRRMPDGNRRETPLFVWARTKVVEECVSASVKHEGRRQPIPLSQMAMAMDSKTMNVDMQYTSWMHSNTPPPGCRSCAIDTPRLYLCQPFHLRIAAVDSPPESEPARNIAGSIPPHG